MSEIDKSKVIQLAKKLSALAERGIGGEKDNATEMLQNIMIKHSITIEDINGAVRQDYEFELAKEIDILFIRQVLSSVVGKITDSGCRLSEFKYVRKRGFKSYILRNIDPSDFSEFLVKVEAHWVHFQSELALFRSAYIQINALYTKPSETKEERLEKQKELSPEDRARMLKIANMAQGIEKLRPQRKRIE